MSVAERCHHHLRHVSDICAAIVSRPRRRSRHREALVLHRVGPSRLRVAGELDLASAPLLAAALLDQRIERIDLEGVTFVDAAGIAVLLEAVGPGDRQRRLVLGSPSRSVHRLVDLCTLDASLTIAS